MILCRFLFFDCSHGMYDWYASDLNRLIRFDCVTYKMDHFSSWCLENPLIWFRNKYYALLFLFDDLSDFPFTSLFQFIFHFSADLYSPIFDCDLKSKKKTMRINLYIHPFRIVIDRQSPLLSTQSLFTWLELNISYRISRFACFPFLFWPFHFTCLC